VKRLAGLARLLCALWVGGALLGCAAASTTPAPPGAPGAPGGACAPTDQDRYVYQPARLKILRACLRVSGVVEDVEPSPDGDITFLLRLDLPYRGLLTPANRGQRGDLVVEPVCTVQPVIPGPIALCASDPDPYAGPFPTVGEHVWMEGRYALDLNHGGWAELHPLYRAGALSP
jgi:hypothetical protein